MPNGKPAGVRCVQLTAENACLLFGRRERPEVCRQLRPEPVMCGSNAGQAMAYLDELERLTLPISVQPPTRCLDGSSLS